MVTHTGVGDRQGHKDDIFHARRVPPVPWQSLHTGCDSAFFPSSAEDSKESPSATHGAAGICSSLPPSFSAPHPSPLTQLQPLAALPGANAGLWELREQQSPEPLWPLLGAGCAGDRHSHGHSWWGTKPVSQPQLVLPAWQGMSSYTVPETLFTIRIRAPGSLGRMAQLATAMSPCPSQHPVEPQSQEGEELECKRD